MSEKQTVMGPRGPEKTPGFFSWRHRTNAEHTAAREAYQAEHGRKARQRKAREREGSTPVRFGLSDLMGRRARDGELDPRMYSANGHRLPAVSR